MQRSQSFTILPWPCSQETDIDPIALEVVGRVCAKRTGFNEHPSGDLSLRLTFCPHENMDIDLVKLVNSTMPYLVGAFYKLGISFGQIKKFTAVLGRKSPGGKVEVFIEEIDSC